MNESPFPDWDAVKNRMPTYQYRCKTCDYEFEEWQAMSADPLVKCPSCRRNTLTRVISGAGLIFKGSGFYLTDYKKDKSKSKEKEKAPAAEKRPDTPSSENASNQEPTSSRDPKKDSAKKG